MPASQQNLAVPSKIPRATRLLKQHGRKRLQDKDGGFPKLIRLALGGQRFGMAYALHPGKRDWAELEEPDVNQGMLQHDDAVMAPVTENLGTQAFDRNRWPLDDLGKQFPVRQQCAGDVVQQIMSAALIKNALDIMFKRRRVVGIGRVTTVDKLNDVKARVHFVKQCHIRRSCRG